MKNEIDTKRYADVFIFNHQKSIVQPSGHL
jgi:hypothetical protein